VDGERYRASGLGARCVGRRTIDPGRATTPKRQIRGRRPAASAPCHTDAGLSPDGGWRHAEPTREDPRGRPAARS